MFRVKGGINRPVRLRGLGSRFKTEEELIVIRLGCDHPNGEYYRVWKNRSMFSGEVRIRIRCWDCYLPEPADDDLSCVRCQKPASRIKDGIHTTALLCEPCWQEDH